MILFFNIPNIMSCTCNTICLQNKTKEILSEVALATIPKQNFFLYLTIDTKIKNKRHKYFKYNTEIWNHMRMEQTATLNKSMF